MRRHHQGCHQGQHIKHLLLLAVPVGVHLIPQGVAHSDNAADLFQEKVEVILNIFKISGNVRVDGLVLDQMLQDLQDGTHLALDPVKFDLASQESLLYVFGDPRFLSGDETGKPPELSSVRGEDRREFVDGYVNKAPQDPGGVAGSEHRVISLDLSDDPSKKVLLVAGLLPLRLAQSHGRRRHAGRQKWQRRQIYLSSSWSVVTGTSNPACLGMLRFSM
mmetsp:Transcript_67445/g.158198  ORF Transcript_67445/g.158198 Transcript_67445/m.158198 type:complete len:219 (+) Transcript_67445:304-960(+)